MLDVFDGFSSLVLHAIYCSFGSPAVSPTALTVREKGAELPGK